MSFKKSIFLFLVFISSALLYAQPEDEEKLKFLKKYCADKIDADKYIFGFSSSSFNNATITDDEWADRILLFAESFGDGFWPTYARLEEWFNFPITVESRQKIVSWMLIMRSKEDFLRKNRRDVVGALYKSSFPWNDETFSYMVGTANSFYKVAEDIEKPAMEILISHLIYGEFLYRDGYIDPDLVEYSLYTKANFTDLAMVLLERKQSHDGNFKEVNELFKSSVDKYEKYVQLIKDKSTLPVSKFVQAKKENIAFLADKEVTREDVMMLISDYKVKNDLPLDPGGLFTNEKVDVLLFIVNEHGTELNADDRELLFGPNNEGGLYNYLYQNLGWHNNYQDFILLTFICACQPSNIGDMSNYKFVMDGAQALGLVGTLPPPLDLGRELDKSSLVDRKTSQRLYVDVLTKVQIGYSLLRVSLVKTRW